MKGLLTSPVSLPVPSRPPCCGAPPPPSGCAGEKEKKEKKEKVLNGGPLRAARPPTRTLMRVNSGVSSATNMHHAAVSHMPPAKQRYLSTHTHTHTRSQENTLSTGRAATLQGTFLLGLHISERAKFRYMLHTEFWGGGRL